MSTLETLAMLHRRHNGDTARGPYTAEQLHKLAVLVQHRAAAARASHLAEQEKRANIAKALLPMVDLPFTGSQAVGTGLRGVLQSIGGGVVKGMRPLRDLLATPVVGGNASKALFPTPGRAVRKTVDKLFPVPGDPLQTASKSVPEAMARAAEGTVQGIVENPGAAFTAGFMGMQGLDDMARMKQVGSKAVPRVHPMQGRSF